MDITIVPNEPVSLDVGELYRSVIEEATERLLAEEGEAIETRAIIQDKSGHGVVLPAKIENGKVVFVLPEQLSIFVPSQTYILKVEAILDSQLMTPVITEVRIEPGAFPGEEGVEGDLPPTQGEELPQKASEDDPEIDAVLDLVAPLPKPVAKKARVEDLVKQLDEEFVKNALWKKPEEKQMAPEVLPPKPQALSPEQDAMKQKMKNLLRNMLT